MDVIDFSSGKKLSEEQIRELTNGGVGSSNNLLLDIMIQEFFKVNQSLSEQRNSIHALNLKLKALEAQIAK